MSHLASAPGFCSDRDRLRNVGLSCNMKHGDTAGGRWGQGCGLSPKPCDRAHSHSHGKVRPFGVVTRTGGWLSVVLFILQIPFLRDFKTAKLHPCSPFVSFVIGYVFAIVWIENVDHHENSILLMGLSPSQPPFQTIVLVMSPQDFIRTFPIHGAPKGLGPCQHPFP